MLRLRLPADFGLRSYQAVTLEVDGKQANRTWVWPRQVSAVAQSEVGGSGCGKHAADAKRNNGERKTVDDAARHLDTYPNFVIDTAAKVRYLAYGSRERVREFLLKYQDRVLCGTDFSLTARDEESAWKSLQATYERDWGLFSSAGKLQYGGREVQGLALPDAVLRKIFYANAVRWLPGMVPK